MSPYKILCYIAVMALTTYLIRMLPLAIVKTKITNSFIKSFLYYVPYAVLTVMTVPAIFYCTQNTLSAVLGLGAALILAWNKKSLITVALSSCAVVFAAEWLIGILTAA